MSDNSNPEKKGNKVLTYVIILLAVAVIFFGFQVFQKQQELTAKEKAHTELTEAHSSLQNEFESSIEELKKQKGNNAELDSILNVKIAEIESLMKDAKKNKNTIYALRKQRNKLQTLTDNNKLLIDSLVQANNWLIGQNDSLGTELTSSNENNKVLRATNADIIKRGSALSALNVIGIGQRKKSNGKVSPTDKAKKVNRVQVCFDVAENKLAKKESKEVYLRLVGPGSDVLTIENQGSGKLRLLEGEPEMEYSKSKNVMYTNNSMNVCMYWEQNKPFNPGKYTSEIYAEGQKIGDGEFSLR